MTKSLFYINNYPFGMLQPGRFWQSGDYRYGFNGMEKDDEIKGVGNSYSTHFRGYDPRLGRWLSLDPKPTASESWFVGFGNNPIMNTDVMGDTIITDTKGFILSNDEKDNLVFMKEKKDLKPLGEVGKTIDANIIFKNLLNSNMEKAKDSNPFKFKELVTDEGLWDFKTDKESIFGYANDNKTKFKFEGKELESQDIGNMHFGATAKCVPVIRLLGETFILKQAGQNQIDKGISRPEWIKYKSTFYPSPGGGIIEKEMLPPYGDDPRDQKWIMQGFRYYDKKKK